MMAEAPGVLVQSRAARPARGEPTDTGVGFVIDYAEWGPHDQAKLVNSLDEAQRVYGDRVGFSLLHDALETFFAEEGASAYVSRQVGPAPVKASLILVDRAGVPLNTLRIDGLYVGDRGNRFSVEVQDGTDPNTFRLVVFFDDIEVERFDNLVMEPVASANYAPTRLAVSEYIRGVDLASASVGANANPAVLAKTDLAGGTDDHANGTNATFETALNLFTSDLGPGQVIAPGRTDLATHTSLIEHAVDQNFLRTPYLDVPDKANKATLQAAMDAVENLAGAEAAGLIGSWVDIPGLTAGTTRAVPGSAYAAGVTNRADRQEGTAGAAPAGEISAARFALAVRLPVGGFSESDYGDLNENGVNMIRDFRNRGVQLYGFRSLSKNSDWVQLTAQRLRMSLTAKLEAAWRYVPFRRVDGRGRLLSEANGLLKAVCKEEWEADALFGETQEEAFRVDTGPTINTEATIAAGEVHAAVYARFAPFAEKARIDLVKVPASSSV